MIRLPFLFSGINVNKQLKKRKMDYERFLKKIELQESEMLLKYYNLKKTDINCPKKSYLLQPETLQLSSYEVLPNNEVKLSVGYRITRGGCVGDIIRIHYDQYVFGTLFCEQVKFVKKKKYDKIGIITIPFFSKSKILNLPVQNSHNISIRCKNIRVKDIDTYVKDNDGKFILEQIYRDKLRGQLENNTTDND